LIASDQERFESVARCYSRDLKALLRSNASQGFFMCARLAVQRTHRCGLAASWGFEERSAGWVIYLQSSRLKAKIMRSSH
jgi:hypothetical protein